MYQIAFYVPERDCEKVKEAMFNAGAGRIGNYDRCAWQCLGAGQFRPLEGSRPALGEQHKVHFEPELKVEMVCAEGVLQEVISALKKAHPYETPAYSVLRILDL